MATENPYQTPEEEFPPPVIGEYVVVPAMRGVEWVTEGFSFFLKAPGPWLLITIIWSAIWLVGIILNAIMIIPVISIVLNMILPLFMGGVMLGCSALDQGETLTVDHLFVCFRDPGQRKNLLILGGLYIAALLVVLLIAFILMLILGGGLIAISSFGDQIRSGNSGEAMLMGMALLMILGLLIVLALSLPLLMALWFAPALIVLDNQSPLDAARLSFLACFKNTVPFLIYGLIGLIASIAALIPAGLGMFVLIPVIIASVYISYKDIFHPLQ